MVFVLSSIVVDGPAGEAGKRMAASTFDSVQSGGWLAY